MSPLWSKHVAVNYRRTKMKCSVVVCNMVQKKMFLVTVGRGGRQGIGRV